MFQTYVHKNVSDKLRVAILVFFALNGWYVGFGGSNFRLGLVLLSGCYLSYYTSCWVYSYLSSSGWSSASSYSFYSYSYTTAVCFYSYYYTTV